MSDQRTRRTVWVQLQIEAEDAAFAERQWSKYGYFSRDDYLNGLLNMALMSEMTELPLRLQTGNPDQLPDDLDHGLPF